MGNDGIFLFAILCAAIVWRYFYDQSHKPPEHRVTIGELQIYLTAFASLQANLSILFQMSNFKAAAQAGVERIARF